MKRALIIGGARSGIGQAVSLAFQNRGFKIVATVEQDDLSESQDFIDTNPQMTFLPVSSAEPASYFEAIEKCRTLDFECAVVADFYFYVESTSDFDKEKWDRSLFANLTVPKLVGHEGINSWPACKSVTFITSSEANTGSFGAHCYAATKSATHNLARSLANAADGKCRFNCIAAGWIGGVMDTDEVFNRSRSITPLGRLGSPEEVAEAVAWIACDAASFVNGATLLVDGGYTGVDTVSKYEYEAEFGTLRK